MKNRPLVAIKFYAFLFVVFNFLACTTVAIRQVNLESSLRDTGSADSLREVLIRTRKGLIQRGRAPGAISKNVHPCLASRVERLTAVQHLLDILDAKNAYSHNISSEFLTQVQKDYTFFAPVTPLDSLLASRQSTLVTGYYEPVLSGSRFPSDRYKYPLYRLPPYEYDRTKSRKEIDYEGGLQAKGLEILWVDSDIDRFFLQIQGSGVVRLEDSTIVRVGYAGKNGQAYLPIGKYLVQQGYLSLADITMDSIKSYLASHPNQVPDILSQNASYVFFEERSQGATGSFGVELTQRRSFASDATLLPPGSLAAVEFEQLSEYNPTPNAYLMVGLDTGGAVKGPQHIDAFLGQGETAGKEAGEMKGQGLVTLLVLRECVKFYE
jgi:membrane-bound lytic murein transglycosylase A